MQNSTIDVSRPKWNNSLLIIFCLLFILNIYGLLAAKVAIWSVLLFVTNYVILIWLDWQLWSTCVNNIALYNEREQDILRRFTFWQWERNGWSLTTRIFLVPAGLRRQPVFQVLAACSCVALILVFVMFVRIWPA